MTDDKHLTDMQSMSDEELVALSHAGNDDADAILYERYKNIVRIKARPYFLIGADREDLIQEGMIGLYKSIRDYEDGHGAQFRSFAEICIVRQILSAIKSATRMKHTPLNTYISFYNSGSDNDGDRPLIDTMVGAKTENPEDMFILRESMCSLLQSIDKMLTPLEKRVLERFLDGKSYVVISEDLDCSTKCVDNALQRVKKKLSQSLRKYDESTPSGLTDKNEPDSGK